MGIEGLLKLIDPITIKQHISSFANMTVAVDIMSWIYKGCYRCAFELNQKIQSNNYLYYIFEMIDLLTYYKIKPICVFDGRYVTHKNATIEKRQKSKEDNKEKGLQCLKDGKYQEAKKYLSRCIIIDERIISTIMRAFHTKKIEFMVAPYESDSQIAKLFYLKVVDFAISEDSDLIIYGLKVIMKLNQDGDCNFVDLSRWKAQDVDSIFLKQFLKMNHQERIESAVLSGTDYNKSIKGIGIKKAIKHLSKYKTSHAVVDHLKGVKPFSEKIPENYQNIVREAKLIFLLATVYNPFTKSLQPLNPDKLNELIPEGMTENQLKKITGIQYDFDEDVAVGRINAKNLQIRDIHKIDIKTVFKLDINSLALKEEANRQRRFFFSSAKKRRQNEQSQIKNSGMNQSQRFYSIEDKNDFQQQEERKKIQEQKKRNTLQTKLERVKKLNEFKSLLDSFSDFESDSENDKDSDDEFQEDRQRNPQQITESKVKKVAEYFNKLSDSESDKDDSQISSAEVNQQNPWAKDKKSSSKKIFR